MRRTSMLGSRLSAGVFPKNIPRPRARPILPSHPGVMGKLLGHSYSTTVGNSRGIPVPVVFGVLTLLGAAGTAYGLYDYYASFLIWPQELREDLRSAIKAQHHEDYRTSAKYYSAALNKARNYPDPVATLGTTHALKTSGIAIALGAALEEIPDLTAASKIYKQALDDILNSKASSSSAATELDTKTRMRCVAISVHLADLANRVGDPVNEEAHLVWATGEVLRIIRGAPGSSSTSEPSQKSPEAPSGSFDSEETLGALGELVLPKWVNKMDVGGVLERLGEYYARTGNVEYAVPLYLQAISVLIPPPDSTAWRKTKHSADDRCKGASLMNNLASLFANPPTSSGTKSNIPQAKAWASKALEVVEKARAEGGAAGEGEVGCDQVLSTVLFNMGMLCEMEADKEAARHYFQRTLKHSKETQFREGIREANRALKRLPVS